MIGMIIGLILGIAFCVILKRAAEEGYNRGYQFAEKVFTDLEERKARKKEKKHDA